MLFWLISLYPIRQTCELLTTLYTNNDNNLNLVMLEHWCTFWLIYAILLQYNFILSYIPFWNLISSIILISSYNPLYMKYLFENSYKALQYNWLFLNKTTKAQTYLDFLASNYIIPTLNSINKFAETLPPSAKSLLVRFSQICHAVLICEKDVQQYNTDFLAKSD